MSFIFEERPSDSSFVERIWRTHNEPAGCSFISGAASNWEMVVTKQSGKVTLTVRGPETKASIAPIPAEADFIGIQFKLGTFMPHLPAINLLDGGINLPEACGKTFWLNGSAWQYPDFENMDTFVKRLIRTGLLEWEPVVTDALQGRLKELSLRSVQRRFLRATGITLNTVRQIERASHAVKLLEQGVSILDTVEEAGYSDQPHLTRALKYYMGQTPAQIISNSQSE